MATVQKGDLKFIRYSGRSMWPCFQEGDLLMVRTVPLQQLRRGDCIVYQADDARDFTVHRVVAVDPEIWTKGDAHGVWDDSPVVPEWFLGKVEKRIRYGQTASVVGGVAGVVEGVFYHYAGRIDPDRDSRGGRAARACLTISTRLLALMGLSPRVAMFRGANGRTARYIIFGKRIVGKMEEDKRALILWPFSLICEFPVYIIHIRT